MSLTPSEAEAFEPGVMSRPFVAKLPSDNVFTILEMVQEVLGGPFCDGEPVTILKLKETRKVIKVNNERRKQLFALFGDVVPDGKTISLSVEHIKGGDQIALSSPNGAA